MSESNPSERTSRVDLELRAADLRIAWRKSQKDWLDKVQKEHFPEEKRPRGEIIIQLELEKAAINREFLERYRNELTEIAEASPELYESLRSGCWFCAKDCTVYCPTCVGCVSEIFSKKD